MDPRRSGKGSASGEGSSRGTVRDQAGHAPPEGPVGRVEADLRDVAQEEASTEGENFPMAAVLEDSPDDEAVPGLPIEGPYGGVGPENGGELAREIPHTGIVPPCPLDENPL